MPSLREIGKNSLLFLIGFVLSLVIVEVTLRFYNPLGFRIKGNKIILPINRIQIIHNKIDGKLDEVVVHKKNSLGFRGEEPPQDFDTRLTVITVGGSTTECAPLNEEKTWPHLLQKRLKTHFPDLWLNNAGFCGHTTFGHTILMQELPNIRPKSGLFLVGFNDIGQDNISHMDQRLQGIGFKKSEEVLITAANYSEVASILLNLYRFYYPAYVTVSDINEFDIRTSKQKEIPSDKEEATIENHRRKFLQPYRQRLERLVDLALHHQIDPVLITQPLLCGEGVDAITGVNLGKIDAFGITSGKVSWRTMELYNEVTRQLGKERSILVIDLARELPKSSLYYYDLLHYSHEGCEKIAEIICSHLIPYYAKKYPNHYQVLRSE